MKLRMFAVYDSKVEAFLQPFFMQTRGQAIRSWGEVVNDPQTQFCKFPTDFTLFEIGEYDDAKGVVENCDTKVNLGVAIDFKNKQSNQMELLK